MRTSRHMAFGRLDLAGFVSFFAYAAGSVVIPVALVILSRELGFSLTEGGMTAGGALHLGRTVPIVLSMVLCGFVAGHWGKRRTFGWSVLLVGFGLGLCALAPGYGVLLLALVVAGFGEGVIEGLATPFIKDLHPDEPGRYINFAHAFWPIGVLTTVLVSGGLLAAGVSWRILVAAIACLSLVPAALLLLPSSRGQRYPDHPERLHWSVVRDQAQAILRQRRFWIFFAGMFVAGGGEYCLTYWSASYIQLNVADSPWAGGAGTACFAAGMVLARTGWGYLMHQKQLRGLIIVSGLAGVPITLLIPHAASLGPLLGLLFLAGVATAPFWPSIQSYSLDRLPGADSTMLLVLLSCAGVPGCGFFTWLMGFIADRSDGLATAFYLVPACYLVLAILMLSLGGGQDMKRRGSS